MMNNQAATTLAPELVERATTRLSESSHLFLRHVRCRLDAGALCIEGKVPSFYLKQTAQSLVQDAAGGPPVENRLEVVNAYGVSSTA